MRKIFFIIALFLCGNVYSQYSIRGTILSPAADTTSLKLLSGKKDGTVIYLVELASGDAVGSGWFVYEDSTCFEGVIAYSAGTVGKQWIRDDYLINKSINTSWAGTVNIAAAAISTNGGILLIDNIKHTITASVTLSDNTLINGLGTKSKLITTTNSVDILSASSKTHLHIKNVRFVGQGSKTSQGNTGVKLNNCSEILIESCSFDSLEYAIEILGTTKDVVLLNCTFGDSVKMPVSKPDRIAGDFIDCGIYVTYDDSAKYLRNTLRLTELFSTSPKKVIVINDTIWMNTLTLENILDVDLMGGTNNAGFIRRKPSDDNIVDYFFHLKNCSDWTVRSLFFNARTRKYRNRQRWFSIQNDTVMGENFKFIDNTLIQTEQTAFWGNYNKPDYCFQNVQFIRNHMTDSCETLGWIYRKSRNFLWDGNSADSAGCWYIAKGDSVYNSRIVNNEASYTYDSAIYLNGTGNVVSNNTIENAGKDGIKIVNYDWHDCVISNNIIRGAGLIQAGGGSYINVEGFRSNVYNNLIIGADSTKTLIDVGTGIYSFDGSDHDIKGNRVINNGFRNAYDGNIARGVWISQGDERISVTYNRIDSVNAYGIVISGAVYATSDVSIKFNEINGKLKGIYVFPLNGALLHKRLSIVGNEVNGTVSDAFRIEDVDELLLKGNWGSGNTVDWLDIRTCNIVKNWNNYEVLRNPVPEYSTFSIVDGDSIFVDESQNDYLKFDTVTNRFYLYINGAKVDSLN